MPTPKSVHIGYGPYKTKQEAQEAEDNAWLAIPLSERQRIVRENSQKQYHLESVANGDEDCGNCSLCREKAMENYEVTHGL